MTHHELVLLGRVALAFALCFVHRLRTRAARARPPAIAPTPWSDSAAAAITAVTEHISPQAIAGVITGIGFIGGGLVFREGVRNIRGITSAATILAAAGIGIVAGTGHWLLAILVGRARAGRPGAAQHAAA